MKTKDEAESIIPEAELGTGKTYTSRRSRQSLQFDIGAGIKRFARVVAELQSAGVGFELHQNGDLVWIDFDVQ